MLITATVTFALEFPFAYDDATEQDAIEWEDFDAREDGPSDEDVAFYVDEILSGRYDDERDARDAWMEDCYDPDERDFFPGDEYSALDAYERSFYGD